MKMLAAGAAPPDGDPDVGAFACQLGGDRGFTFRRAAPAGDASATSTPARPAGAAPMAARGSADLRLAFPSGSAALDDGDRARLAGRHLRIEGHTDARGAAAANPDLSRRRARSVADCLGANGVAADRLHVVGYGATRPLPGHAASDGANRRVMAVMLD